MIDADGSPYTGKSTKAIWPLKKQLDFSSYIEMDSRFSQHEIEEEKVIHDDAEACCEVVWLQESQHGLNRLGLTAPITRAARLFSHPLVQFFSQVVFLEDLRGKQD